MHRIFYSADTSWTMTISPRGTARLTLTDGTGLTLVNCREPEKALCLVQRRGLLPAGASLLFSEVRYGA